LYLKFIGRDARRVRDGLVGDLLVVIWKRLTGMVLEVVAISQRLAPLKDGVVLEGGEHLRRIA
jgi:hypothetical protein